jgi:hypothetical protein
VEYQELGVFQRALFSLASFADPDGNGWVLRELVTRVPGR